MMQSDLQKVVLADVAPKTYDDPQCEIRMRELENLVDTYWWLVVVEKIQKRNEPDFHTFIGSWKLDEIIAEMVNTGSKILVLWNILKPRQLYNINEKLRPIGAQARDRVDLILKIFERHASSTEARLQIELAAIKHMGPRIYGMGMELSRQWWWIGTSGIWETNTERMRRHLKEKTLEIERKLKQYENMRRLHRESRLRKNLNTIGIVGYTNAGKSSLMRSLTSKQVLVENKLFATLGTNVWKMFVPSSDLGLWIEVLVNDTIGFIRDLPPQLIKAFTSTLEDSIESQLLLHVVDSHDAQYRDKIAIVDHILDQIGAKQKRLLVFNKIDLADPNHLKDLQELYSSQHPVFVSASNKIWLDELKQRIVSEL